MPIRVEATGALLIKVRKPIESNVFPTRTVECADIQYLRYQHITALLYFLHLTFSNNTWDSDI